MAGRETRKGGSRRPLTAGSNRRWKLKPKEVKELRHLLRLGVATPSPPSPSPLSLQEQKHPHRTPSAKHTFARPSVVIPFATHPDTHTTTRGQAGSSRRTQIPNFATAESEISKARPSGRQRGREQERERGGRRMKS